MKKEIIRKITALITVLAFAVALAACGQQGSIADTTAVSEVTEAKQQADEQDNSSESVDSEITGPENNEPKVLKVSFPTGNIRITVNILALQKGYFEEEGVEVIPVNIGGNDALTAINGDGDELDLLTAGFVADVQAIGSGYDLAFIAGTAVEGGAVIAKKGNADKYKDNEKIINAEAVSNASLGFVRNEAAWIITRQYLLDNGISAEKIAEIENEESGSITYYGDTTETAQAVQKGEIEIGFLPMEFALLYADAYDLEIITPSGDLSPDYVCCREVTSNARLAEKYDALVAYERARIRAFELYKQGESDSSIKEDVIKTVSDYSGKEADYVETYLYGGVTKFSVDPNTVGIQDYIEAANNSGVFSSSATDFSTYDITQNINTSVYQKALEELIEENPDNDFFKSLKEQFNSAN